MSTSLSVTVIPLGASPITASFPPTTPLYRVIYELQGSIGAFGSITLICNMRKVESYGLATPLSSLPTENGTVTFYKTLNLGAYGPVLGAAVELLNKLRQATIEMAVKDANSLPLNEARMNNISNLVEALRARLMQAKQGSPINDKDPITLDDLDSTTAMRWMEGNKVYAMSYDSLLTYVKAFQYTDADGKVQIPNPFTNVPIASPWREEFLALASA